MRAVVPGAGLKVRVAATYAALSAGAADIICKELRSKPDLLLCLSAGGTPTGLYRELAKRQARTPQVFARFRTMGVDEWGGLPLDSPGTCQADLEQKLFRPLRISARRRHLFRSDAQPARAECERMARWLARNGPINICLLGLGLNGHIAMNEPASAFVPGVHVSRLAGSSLKHSMLRSLSHKPRYGLTLGLRDILSSRMVLLLVSGETKRPVLRRLLKPEVTPRFPASFLWLHSNAIVLCDQAAYGPERP